MSGAPPWPGELRVNAGRDTLCITFDNGERHVLGAEYLRVESPSAEVRGHGGGPKIVLTDKQDVKIERLEPVGNYAVRIVFNDGHDSGLYGWTFCSDWGATMTRSGPRIRLRRVPRPPHDAFAQTIVRQPCGQTQTSARQHRQGAADERLAVIKGQDSGRFTDFYYGVLTASWPVFVLQLGALFVTVNLIFAMFYVIDRGGIANARPGSFADAFFFSVQTLGTLGYGVMAPRTLYANLLVTVESFTGILTIALFTGIIFARFSRPVARVVFSKVAVVSNFDGVPTLMFRAANQRGNSILDAAVTVSLARQHTTQEGVTMRRFQELKLMRGSNPLFVLSWTVMHPIDENSPLYGLTVEEMQARDMEIVVMLSGVDEILADRIFARHAYWHDEIQWQRRFVDVISVSPAGTRIVDLTLFHDTISPDS